MADDPQSQAKRAPAVAPLACGGGRDQMPEDDEAPLALAEDGARENAHGAH